MKYYKQYKEADAEAVEVTKAEAKRTLEGWWAQEALDEIFEQERGFRLYTPYADVWTKTDEGLVPMAGFYGTVGK